MTRCAKASASRLLSGSSQHLDILRVLSCLCQQIKSPFSFITRTLVAHPFLQVPAGLPLLFPIPLAPCGHYDRLGRCHRTGRGHRRPLSAVSSARCLCSPLQNPSSMLFPTGVVYCFPFYTVSVHGFSVVVSYWQLNLLQPQVQSQMPIVRMPQVPPYFAAQQQQQQQVPMTRPAPPLRTSSYTRGR